MKGVAVSLLLALSFAGCSWLASVALYNNTAAPVEVCNLQTHRDPCQTVPPYSVAAVTLRADQASSTWKLQIASRAIVRVYDLGEAARANLSEARRCKAVSRSGCMPLQLEADGKLFWIDPSNSQAAPSIPAQPKGFPIAPGA